MVVALNYLRAAAGEFPRPMMSRVLAEYASTRDVSARHRRISRERHTTGKANKYCCVVEPEPTTNVKSGLEWFCCLFAYLPPAPYD